MATYKSFEELDCWKRCRELRIWVHNFIQIEIPREDLDMRNNLKRAARLTTRNIAEGFGRFHYKENVQFCRISRGSLFEIKDDLLICVDEKKVASKVVKEGLHLISISLISLNKYIKYLNNQSNN